MASSKDAFERFWTWKKSRTLLKVTVWTKGKSTRVFVKTGSFELVILAWVVLGQVPTPFQNLEMVYDATRWVVSRIFSRIEVKKHVKNRPYHLSVRGDGNTVLLINAEGAPLAITPDILESIKTKSLDIDLNKIVAPLEAERITAAEIIAETENQPTIREKIGSNERDYFRLSSTVTTQESTLVGAFISLNKQSNRGTFELLDGRHVSYKYSGPDADSFHMTFARKGPIRVTAMVTFDENLNPISIDVKSAHHLQNELPLDSN